MKSNLPLATGLIALFFSLSTYSQIPLYNSYPSASATVYLDFDGQFLEGTSWNNSGPLTLGPANMTNDQITEIFNRVSEDYRPFNINITTDSTRYWLAPSSQRMRVIFTISSSWYGSAGGVSYMGSFTWGDNTPCFVFTALLNYGAKYVSEAASHEVGHTLGLNHQSHYDIYCHKTNEYNSGIGSGEIAWAPIMGNGYYRNFTLWHNGANPWGCNNFQDDLFIITSKVNGFGYRNDDLSGNVSGGVAQTNFVNNRFTVKGIIETFGDKDVFKFTMPSHGLFHLDANPYYIGTNGNGSDLDINVELINGKNILGSYNPDLLLNASIDTMLEAGTYFLRVQSSGNMFATDYASLGSYTLSASFVPSIVLPVRSLELKGTNDNGKHMLNWIIDADARITQELLEISFDGRNFQLLKSFNHVTGSYINVPGDRSIVYYRLHVIFDNNISYYSNIVALRNTANKPLLSNKFVHNSIAVNSPSLFVYTILDYSGKAVANGNLVQGTNHIDIGKFASGMYIIQYNNGQDQYAEKFMNQ